MPTITALVPQPRRKDRLNLFLDGEYAFSIHLSLAQEAGLSLGRRVSYQEIRGLTDREEYQSALDAAFRFLAHRPRSETEVRDRLRRRKTRLRTIDLVITRLKELRVLDDAEFAQQWVANRQVHSPRSQRMVRWELRLKGVEEDLAREAADEVDDEHAAYEAGARRAARLTDADHDAFRKRLGDFLLRRGFGYGVMTRTVDRLWQERNPEDDGAW